MWSKGLGYGGDSFSHYLISRYSWKHPELLLDAWGKPFFTLVTSPFAQLGWPGMVGFNIGCGVLTAYVVYQYCRKIGLPYSWLSIVLLALMPVYFQQIPTGFTEPLFALVVALSAYLFLTENFAAGSALISFLPLVRTEGIGILPLFFVALMVRRKIGTAPLLATGLLFYSVVGYLIKKDFFWLKTESYSGTMYGLKGTLLYYPKLSPYLFGVPVFPLMLVGLTWLFIAFKRDPWRNDTKLIGTAFVMTGGFVALFVAYSVIWARGLFDMIGLTRHIAVTAPGAVVTAMFGVRWLTASVGDRKAVKGAFIAALCILAAYSAYRSLGGVRVELGKENTLTREATLWLKNSGYAGSKIYYWNPIVPFELDTDPFDKSRMAYLFALRNESPPKGAVVFWDAHFGPNEGRLPLQTLKKNSDLVLLKSFVPEPPFTTFKGHLFEIHIFQKWNDVRTAVYASADVH